MAATPPGQRYRLESVLDRGGMGVVYRALDNTTQREVAIKTLNDVSDRGAYEQFRREFEILSNLKHPNIVDIYDVGEFDGHPGFVMPLLPGQNLATLIQAKRLSVERVVDIVSQVCRGLQAAHDSGLVHRDLKPGNIFVLPGDAVKIIDFGIASMVDRRHSMILRGTILYMAPEQTRMKEATAESDLFSLGVVCYEALTGTHPFAGATDEEIFRAIRRLIPPPVSRINTDVSDSISQVVHKAMAKQPSLRFSSADDFKRCLQKAFRGEAIEYFNESRVQERLSRIRAAIESDNYELANDILANLEGEIYHPDVAPLRKRIEHAVRSKQIEEFLANARQRLEVDEYELTLEWIQKVLELESAHPEALGLKEQVGQRRSARQIEDWLRLGQTHLENNSFARAREAVDNVLGLSPTEGHAIQLKADIDRREQEYGRAKKEKEALYREAVRAKEEGELSSALSKLEQIIKLESLAPDTSSAQRQRLYEEIRTEYDQLNQSIEEIRRLRTEKNYDRALELCDEVLARRPAHAVVQDLKLTTQADQRQELHSYIAEVTGQVQKEPDLDRKVAILQEAISRRPGQPDFQQLLQGIEQRRLLVGSIVAKARDHEEAQRFAEGLAQWETLRSIYPQFPGLEFEIHRLQKREGIQRQSNKKMRRVEEIETARRHGDWDRAEALIEDALAEFSGESELIELRSILVAEKQKADEADALFKQATELLERPAGREDGLALLEKAHELNPRNHLIRGALLQCLLNAARDAIDSDWKRADDLVNRAVSLDRDNKDAIGIRALLSDRRRAEEVNSRVAEIRRLEGSGDLKGALEKARLGTTAHPHDKRFRRLETGLVAALSENQASYSRQKDLDQIRELVHSTELEPGPELADSIWQRTQAFAERYSADSEVNDLVTTIHSRLEKQKAKGPETPSPFANPPPAPQPKPESNHTNRSAAMATAFADLQRSYDQLKLFAAANRKTILAGTGALAAVVVIATAWYVFTAPSPADLGASLPTNVAAAITTDPPGAAVFVDGNSVGVSPLSRSVAAGEHVFTARLAGFYDEQVATTLQPATGDAGGGAVQEEPPSVPIHLALRPMPLTLEFDIGLETGTVQLDGQDVINLASGSEPIIRDVPPGRHLVEFVGAGRTTASFAFNYQPGKSPSIAPAEDDGPNPIRAERLRAIVYSGLGGKGQLYSSSAETMAHFGDGAERLFPILDVSLDSGGPTLKEGTWEREISLGDAAEPVLQVFLISNRDEGDVYISANEQDELIVELDGTRLPRYSKRPGQVRLFGLRAGERTLKISKSGFHADPATQRIIVRKDAVVTAQPIRFEPIPTRATFSIVGGEAGTMVSIDGTERGLIAADGTWAADVQPGRRNVTLSRRGYVSASFSQQVSSGQTADIAGREHRLARATGTFVFSGVPPNSQLEYEGTILAAGGSSPKRTIPAPPELPLPTGSYKLTIWASESDSWTKTVELPEGERITITPTFAKLSAPPAPRWSAVLGEGWKDAGDGWQEATAAGISWTTAMPPAGARYSFVIQIPSALFGKGDPVEWVVSILGSTDRYIRFGVNEKEFLAPGAAPRKHDLAGKSEQRVVVEVTASGIRTSIGSSLSITTPASIDMRSAQFGFDSRLDKPIRVKNFQATALSN